MSVDQVAGPTLGLDVPEEAAVRYAQVGGVAVTNIDIAGTAKYRRRRVLRLTKADGTAIHGCSAFGCTETGGIEKIEDHYRAEHLDDQQRPAPTTTAGGGVRLAPDLAAMTLEQIVELFTAARSAAATIEALKASRDRERERHADERQALLKRVADAERKLTALKKALGKAADLLAPDDDGGAGKGGGG